jgi:hypothetical protein
VSPKDIAPPKGAKKGRHAVLAANTSRKKQWDKLCGSHPGAMVTCYMELATHPCPSWPTQRHHRLKGKKLSQGSGPFWEYEVGGGERVRYKQGPNGEAVVVYAGPAPPDTH